MIFASVSVSQVCGEIQEVLHTKWLPVIVECWGEQQTEIDKLKLSGPEKKKMQRFLLNPEPTTTACHSSSKNELITTQKSSRMLVGGF
jgi:hypothetical protein